VIDYEARKRKKEAQAARRVELAKANAWGEGFVLASQRLQTAGLPGVQMEVDELGIPHAVEEGPSVGLCILFQDVNPDCKNYAGAKTLHPGTGPCASHGGNTLVESVGGAFMTAHAIAQTLDVDPWEAMEVILRRAYTWSAWYNAKLATVTDDEDLKRGGAAWDWVQGAERTAELVAKYAKICHDMGIAERRMRQVEVQGKTIAELLSTTLHELGMSSAEEDRARGILDNLLRSMAQRSDVVIQGELAS
jgi:hypothetical protein